jgi:ADP-ribose pyrophosphatase
MLKLVHQKPNGFSGRRIDLEIHTVTNGMGATFDYEVGRVKDAVAVLPIIEEDGQQYVFLLKHDRYPATLNGTAEAIWEVCAGVIEAHETGCDGLIAAANRELGEEVGYSADRWFALGSFYTSPGITTEMVHLWIATNLKMVGQKLEESEKGSIDVVRMTRHAAIDLLRTGKIKDMKTALLIEALSAWPISG